MCVFEAVELWFSQQALSFEIRYTGGHRGITKSKRLPVIRLSGYTTTYLPLRNTNNLTSSITTRRCAQSGNGCRVDKVCSPPTRVSESHCVQSLGHEMPRVRPSNASAGQVAPLYLPMI